ncbi:MAG: GTP pyrophosphokinase [Fusicatenibacter sp.]|nr:GTP pyrophosphokinase [Fusicatenibacter sp.]
MSVNLTKEEFLEKYGILQREFDEADISWEELLKIAEDYEECRPALEQIRKDFVAEILQDREKEMGLQSYHSRLKDTEHLMEKLVRKRIENYTKYRELDLTNYKRFVTDLIGIRGLLLYREDWVNFHKYITGRFQNDPKKYVHNYVRDYKEGASGYMIEPPKVHTRLGDFADIYVNWIPEENILDRKHYRAVHYIVAYKGVYIEIQIKTLFEEGWGEIDHHILYPRKKDNPMLKEFSELLNRLAGMGDEMGSFYRRLQAVPDEEFQGKETIVRKRELKPSVKTEVEKRDLSEIRTAEDAIASVLKE